jgi:hypothetical protein
MGGSCGAVEDDDRNRNNRFEVAAGSIAPSGGRAVLGPSGQLKVPACRFANPATPRFPFDERRRIETLVPRAKTCFS